MQIARRIRDNIHGTINVSALEDRIISHPYVQRLRRIKQTAFLQYVFPGASHSRFEHSLGVMHLAGLAWEKLRENQRRLATSCLGFPHFGELERDQSRSLHGVLGPTFSIFEEILSDPYILQALRLSALLHDLGHPPFSHSGELFLPSWDEMADASGHPTYLKEWLDLRRQGLKAQGKDTAALPVRHEVYTLLLLEHVLKGVEGIAARDLAAIITGEITPDPTSPLQKYGAYRLCHELLSGELDVDRMDYLLRDSRECGVVYGIFDESRLLNSLVIYWNEQDKGLHLGLTFSGLAAFEDFLRARHSMYLQLYFHKTSVAAEAMIKHLKQNLGGWALPKTAEAYARIDEHNVAAVLTEVVENKSAAPAEKNYLKSLVQDLMQHRRLWKRIFEVSSTGSKALSMETFIQATEMVQEMGFKCATLSSSSSLTRLRPRSGELQSAQTLRLIKKDEHQFPRVIPIEDELSLVDGNATVQIARLYVEHGSEENGRSAAETVRQKLKTLVPRLSVSPPRA